MTTLEPATDSQPHISSASDIEEFFRHVDEHDFDYVLGRLSEDCRIEAPGFSQAGGEVVVLWMAGFFAAFPDLRHRPERILISETGASFLLTVTGTHTEDLSFPDGSVLAPTQRPVSVELAEFWKLEDGLVTEYKVVYDNADFLTQLGAFGQDG